MPRLQKISSTRPMMSLMQFLGTAQYFGIVGCVGRQTTLGMGVHMVRKGF